MKENNRCAFLDYAKAISIILVIVQHTWGSGGYGDPIFNYIVRMAVPIFILISGYNFCSSITRLASVKDWFRWSRVAKKMISWTIPMLVVFAIWTVLQILKNPNISLSVWCKAFFEQSYGMGAYYFFIVVELYFIFPFVYQVTRKRMGYKWVALFTLLYEVTMYIFPVSQAIYRLIALRYTMHLAGGIWVHDELKKRRTTRTYGHQNVISECNIDCIFYNWRFLHFFCIYKYL